MAMDDSRPANTNSRRAWGADTMKASVPTINRFGPLTEIHTAAGTPESARPKFPDTVKRGFKAHPRLYLAAQRSVPGALTVPPHDETHRDADHHRQTHKLHAQPPGHHRAEANMGLSRTLADTARGFNDSGH